MFHGAALTVSKDSRHQYLNDYIDFMAPSSYMFPVNETSFQYVRTLSSRKKITKLLEDMGFPSRSIILLLVPHSALQYDHTGNIYVMFVINFCLIWSIHLHVPLVVITLIQCVICTQRFILCTGYCCVMSSNLVKVNYLVLKKSSNR
jgi:hypothetical protein